MPQVHLVVRGGRVPAPGNTGPVTKGQDVALYVRDADGKEHKIPGVYNLTLRIGSRRAIATIEVEVDDVDITTAWLEAIHAVDPRSAEETKP